MKLNKPKNNIGWLCSYKILSELNEQSEATVPLQVTYNL